MISYIAIVTENTYEINNEQKVQTTSSTNKNKNLNSSIKIDSSKIVTYNEDEGCLDIDWKFNFDDLKQADIKEKNGYKYVVNSDSEAIIIGYDKMIDKSTIKIPSKLEKYPVTMIYEDAITNLKNVVNIKLSKGIKVIGMNAFAYNEKLETINIPSTVITIDSYAFDSCYKLNNVEIPDNVINLGEGVFWECISLTDVSIPDHITELRYGFFAGCIGLNYIKIPNNTTKIYNEVFNDCPSLVEIKIPDSVKSIGKSAFKDCNNLEKISIPSSVNSIDESAFENNSKKLTIYLEEGSYAENFATKNKMAYKYVNTESEDKIEEEQLEVIATGTATSVLSVKSEPKSNNSSQFNYIQKGSKIEIVEKYSEKWYKIKYNDTYGYVLSAYVKLDKDEAKITGETTSKLNLRNKPSVDNKKIGVLEKGTKVEIISRIQNGWYKIKYKDIYGYVSGAYVSLDGELGEIKATGITTNNLRVRNGASQNSNEIGVLQKESKVQIVSRLSNGWYKIKYKENYGYVSGAYISLNGEQGKVKATGHTTDNLNVRVGASTSNSRIGYLPKGTQVKIITELSNGWYKIKYNKAYGYISGAYLNIDKQSQLKMEGTTKSDLNVRVGASVHNTKIGVLQKGTEVEVIEKLSNGWYKIKYKKSYGYIFGKYIRLH